MTPRLASHNGNHSVRITGAGLYGLRFLISATASRKNLHGSPVIFTCNDHLIRAFA
jgi:hypothetical protein